MKQWDFPKFGRISRRLLIRNTLFSKIKYNDSHNHSLVPVKCGKFR